MTEETSWGDVILVVLVTLMSLCFGIAFGVALG